jgi:hypothetical protein
MRSPTISQPLSHVTLRRVRTIAIETDARPPKPVSGRRVAVPQPPAHDALERLCGRIRALLLDPLKRLHHERTSSEVSPSPHL